jgi:hypothetical protein
MPMPEIKELGAVIASREMEFRYEDGRTESFFLRVGMPYEYGDGFDWCCPYELATESDRKLFGMFGLDSLQALELTMKTLDVEIEYWEKAKNGKLFFLGEEGAGI